MAFAPDESQVSCMVWPDIEFASHPEIAHPAAGVTPETVLEVPFRGKVCEWRFD